MTIIIEKISDKIFSVADESGVTRTFGRNYECKSIDNLVAIDNARNSDNPIVPLTHFSEFAVDGETFGSTIELITALNDVVSPFDAAGGSAVTTFESADNYSFYCTRFSDGVQLICGSFKNAGSSAVRIPFPAFIDTTYGAGITCSNGSDGVDLQCGKIVDYGIDYIEVRSSYINSVSVFADSGEFKFQLIGRWNAVSGSGTDITGTGDAADISALQSQIDTLKKTINGGGGNLILTPNDFTLDDNSASVEVKVDDTLTLVFSRASGYVMGVIRNDDTIDHLISYSRSQTYDSGTTETDNARPALLPGETFQIDNNLGYGGTGTVDAVTVYDWAAKTFYVIRIFAYTDAGVNHVAVRLEHRS